MRLGYIIRKAQGNINKRKYYKTIASQEWKDFRWEYIKENQHMNNCPYHYFQCEWCRRVLPLKEARLHHTSYKHGLFNKKYLRLICDRCHQWWHSTH